MKTKVTIIAVLCLATAVASAQTTEITYRGRLVVNGNPMTGNYDLRLTPWDATTGGNKFNTEERANVRVENGNFTVNLNFGNIFPGDDRFLEIMYSPAGAGTWEIVEPRDAITSVPYAIKSVNATNAAQLGGVSSGQFVQTSDPRLSDARAPVAGSGNYIQNTTTQQPGSNFNISGTGKANVIDASSQFNLNGGHVLSAPGTANIFVGGAGTSAITGDLNTFVGNASGISNTSGRANVFIGGRAGLSNTSGLANTFVGAAAGYQNASASNNSFFGAESGRINGGGSNSFFGFYSGGSNTTGGSNAFFGSFAGGSNTTGGNNTFVGGGSGMSNTTGGLNTYVGAFAGGSATIVNSSALGHRAYVTQDSSIVLGGIAGVNGSNVDTRVGIGTTAPQERLSVGGGINVDQNNLNNGSVANTVRFGGSSGEAIGSRRTGGTNQFGLDFYTGFANRMVITNGGNVGIGTAAPNDRLEVNGIIRFSAVGSAGGLQLCRNLFNQISHCSSSLRYKTNIAPFTPGLSFVVRLHPIAFDWKLGGNPDVGFGAEDVAKVDPRFVTFNDRGEVEGVKYDRIGVVLINAVKEQQAQIEKQQEQIRQMQAQVDLLKKLLCRSDSAGDMCRE